MIKTSKEALATHLNMDYADLKDYEYQYGRSVIKIYAFDDAYYCAMKDNKPLPRKEEFNWVEVPDVLINKFGFKIYKSEVISTDI